jgi:hypothetical protein
MGWFSPGSITSAITGAIEKAGDYAETAIPSVAKTAIASETEIPTWQGLAYNIIFDRLTREGPQPAPQVITEAPVYTTYPTSGQAAESGGYIDIPSGPAPVYEGFAGAIPGLIGGVIGGLSRGLRTPLGGAAVGGAAGLLSQASGNGCGCGPKQFVRFNKCGEPIITRKMKKQAIEAVNCQGPQAAAAALTGGDGQLLLMITSKQFPPKRMGISGAQLNTTMRTMTKLDRAHKKMQSMCKPSRTYTRRK